MKRKLAILLSVLSLILILSPITVCAKDYEKEDTLSSENIVVYNMDMGFSVYRKNYNEKISPGSTVKIMTALLALRFFIFQMPTAAAVPSTVAITAESTARIRVFLTAVTVSLDENSSRYQRRENPENTDVLLDSLKEKNTITRSGA